MLKLVSLKCQVCSTFIFYFFYIAVKNQKLRELKKYAKAGFLKISSLFNFYFLLFYIAVKNQKLRELKKYA